VRLTHLSLTNFRNFTRLDIDPPSGSILLYGDNAQGKTSLLEAIYLLATFVSFHASSERQMIHFLALREPLAVARIVAAFQRGEASHRLEVRIIQEPTLGPGGRLRKEILFDGVKQKASEVIGQFNAVLFLPQMLQVIDGAPEERRRFVNLTLAQVLRPYSQAISLYTRSLAQRNALLKQLAERGGDPAQLDFWDLELATAGAKIIHSRIRAIQELERIAARFHRDLTRGGEVLRLCYQPAYDPLPRPQNQFALPLEDCSVDRSRFTVEQIRQGFLEKLIKVRSEEIARGVTVTGPHRDELRFLSNGIDLGTYGSRGQIRTAMLSIKLAEVMWMREKTGHWPVLLFDEVLAELDANRRADLLERVSESEQSFLTTTDLDLFAHPYIEKAALWQVTSGRVEPAPPGSEPGPGPSTR
jgi:DNA replication and repair protein RecF